jgi:ribosomal protein S18 acetylase RimI-like enzyme
MATPVALNSSKFRAIQGWPFPDEPFYVRQVPRMLLSDIPQWVLFGRGVVFGYTDHQAGRDIVGFGTLSVSNLYSQYTDGLEHCYIPLLAVKPGIKSYGYGQSIVDHLVAQAAIVFRFFRPGTISDRVFLDVYTANDKACRLYREKCEFVTLNPDAPIPDEDENNEPYVVMARNVAVLTGT